ncbi:hypothetical protein DDD_1683 [Nonlabens dokdonensis DSW-6]|uniref:Uncharacterized protein n=1 Tax=Nonlabens dokdonensis (strain DSM 17205 / KCTC 12402 / DSW-6) TaxID=592029 RepID=L7W5A9_NONDD|nr:hypothetical protein DDD_1683 [Nonlabens dokdonensis DSW-6]
MNYLYIQPINHKSILLLPVLSQADLNGEDLLNPKRYIM